MHSIFTERNCIPGTSVIEYLHYAEGYSGRKRAGALPARERYQSMNELYKEILVKRKAQPLDMVKKAGMILLTVIAFVIGFLFIPLMMIGTVLLGLLAWYVITGLNLEYEYLYVNGDIDVDRIKNRERRKRVGSYELVNMEILAPSNSHELDSYLNNKSAKIIDYTSGDESVQSYTAVYTNEANMQIVRLELTKEVVDDIRRRAPRKVSRDTLLLK